jgi:hypothetical protein
MSPTVRFTLTQYSNDVSHRAVCDGRGEECFAPGRQWRHHLFQMVRRRPDRHDGPTTAGQDGHRATGRDVGPRQLTL